ncbi:ATP-binding cassette domain-containing protein [Microbacterium sp. MAHUQ-60]|uniref:ABC transporter ATP-binding protein n=1 Tax=unclassified Microbacterium TaxID=2609290 RepID=UPI0036071F48
MSIDTPVRIVPDVRLTPRLTAASNSAESPTEARPPRSAAGSAAAAAAEPSAASIADVVDPEAIAPGTQAAPESEAALAPATTSDPEVEAAPEPEAAPASESDVASTRASDVAPETDAASEAEAAPVPETIPAAEPETESAPEPEAASDAPIDSETLTPITDESPSAPEADEDAVDAIRIRGLVKRFGDAHAVDGVDLTVPAGSFYGLVGPNGAGKTTTLSIIAGLLRPDAGTVHISGIDQRVNPLAAKRVMGVLPDRLRTFDRLTGRQLLHYYGQLRGLDRAVIDKRIGDLARAFDLTEALSRVVSDYSAGMTKKLMIAGALIHSPRVLVLDEPFEAVDPVSSGVILDILRSYVAHGGTVILSSHGMDLVERVCSRVAVIVDGEVLAEGTIDEVRAGQTLAARFVELSGVGAEVEGLEWLHTFSA